MVLVIIFPNLSAQAVQNGGAVPAIVHQRGTVVAPCSYRGMTMERARQLCPEARVFLRQPVYERHLWETILGELWSYTPWIEPLGIDAMGQGLVRCRGLASSDLIGWLQERQGILGQARRTITAHLAALTGSLGERILIADDDEDQFLDQLSVHILSSIVSDACTPAFFERLELFGIRTVGILCRLTEQQLRAQFGVQGKALWRICERLHTNHQDQPIDLYQPAPSYSTDESIIDGTCEPAQLMQAIEKCLTRLLLQLNPQRREGVQQLDLTLHSRSGIPVNHQTRILARATADRGRLTSQLMAMLHHAEHTIDLHTTTVWSVRLRFAMLSNLPAEQLPMFSARTSLQELQKPLATRFPAAICRIHLLDPHAYLPESFAQIRPL